MNGVLSHDLQAVGAIVLALLAAATLVLAVPRARGTAMAATLVLAPVLLVADIWDTPQFRPIRDRPALAVAAAIVGIAVIAAGAVAVDRRPSWLVLAAVAMLPFRVPIESGGQASNLLVPLYAVIAAGAGAYIVAALRGRVEPGRRPRGLERVIALVLVLYAIQGAYSSDTGKALEQVVFFYAPFALLFVLLCRARWSRELALRCLGVLVVLAVVFAGVGFVEYATRHVFLNPRIVASNEFESYFRVNSLFFDPNIYGRFLMIVMLALLAVALWTRRRRVVVAAAAGLALLWAALILTLSQSSLSALLVGMAVLGGLKWNPRRAAYLAGGFVAVGVVVVVLFSGSLRVNVGNGKTLSQNTSGRSELVQGGWDLFKRRPLQGWGSASFAEQFRRQQHVSAERAISASHTIPVTVAAEQGLIGLLPYLALLVLAFMRLLPGSSRDVTRAAIAGAFVALVFHTMLYAAFLEDPLTWTLLGLGTAALADAPRRRDRSIEAPAADPTARAPAAAEPAS